jgi:hypothetical protein
MAATSGVGLVHCNDKWGTFPELQRLEEYVYCIATINGVRLLHGSDLQSRFTAWQRLMGYVY